MAEYIEREALPNCKECIHDGVCGLQERCFDIELQLKEFGCDDFKPAADVIEVRRGKWLPSRNGINPIRCDKCNMPALYVQEQDGFGGFGFYRCPSNYCPNCGAKMDGKGEGE